METVQEVTTSKGNNTITTGIRNDLIEAIGGKFHEERRKTRLNKNGRYEPRIESTTDEGWITQHNGETKVDIANTDFEDLPINRKSENLQAANVVLELLYDKIKSKEEITPELIEEMAKKIHEKRLERNGKEGSFINQRVEYEELSEEEKQKDRNQILRAIEIIKKKIGEDYFNGKKHKYNIDENQARKNSEMMDNLIKEIGKSKDKSILENLKNEINKQYKIATNTEKDLILTDEQIITIITAHKMDGILGKLTMQELKEKTEKLGEKITDPEIRRFLLETGFCGSVLGGIEKTSADVVAIGDLHGKYEALIGNTEFAGIVEEENGQLKRIGGNKKVVFQGDILADRGTDGLKIINEIHKLREQAQKEGGDIQIIVGNHDDFLISYLLGTSGKRYGKGTAIDIAKINEQGKGITELLKFTGIQRIGEESDYMNLRNNKAILQTMRKTKEGRLILEEICNMKIVYQIDDVLYCHTNPTTKMLEYLTKGNLKENIKIINQKYQGYLRSRLLGEGNNTINEQEFNYISDIFLNTSNRDIGGIEKFINILKDNGISIISHGHSGGNGTWYGEKNIYKNNIVDIEGFLIIDNDYGFMHSQNNPYGKGHSVLYKDGKGNVSGGDDVYEKIHPQENKQENEAPKQQEKEKRNIISKTFEEIRNEIKKFLNT